MVTEASAARATDTKNRRPLPFNTVIGEERSLTQFAKPVSSEGQPRQSMPPPQSSVSPELISELQAIALPFGIVLAALASKLLYLDLIVETTQFPVSVYLGAGLLAAIIFYLITQQSSLQSAPHVVTGPAQMRNIVFALSLSFLLLVSLFYLLKISDYFSRLWLCLWYVLSLSVLALERLGFRLWARLLRAETRLQKRVAVYGTVPLAERVIAALNENIQDYVVVGIFSDEGVRTPGTPTMGGMSELIADVRSGACDRVIIALPLGEKERIREAVESLDALPIDVQLSPDAMCVPCELQGSQAHGGLVLLDVQHRPLSVRGSIVKSAMDYVVAACAIVVLAPVMAVIAVAIKLDSPGPVLFVQKRHGYNHRIIRVLKFRSMFVSNDDVAVIQAVRGDDRITRIGRFLRRSSLDELPQLFNVLRGELSLVGPRPHAVSHNNSYAQILSRYANRHKVKPGITGWAQVNGFRGETKTPDAMRQRLELDLHYIKHWSPALDVKILVKTTLVPFIDKNAY